MLKIRHGKKTPPKVCCLPLLFLAVHVSAVPLGNYFAIDRSSQDAGKYWPLLIASSNDQIIARAYESRDRSPLQQQQCQCHHALVSLRPTITCFHMTTRPLTHDVSPFSLRPRALPFRAMLFMDGHDRIGDDVPAAASVMSLANRCFCVRAERELLLGHLMPTDDRTGSLTGRGCGMS